MPSPEKDYTVPGSDLCGRPLILELRPEVVLLPGSDPRRAPWRRSSSALPSGLARVRCQARTASGARPARNKFQPAQTQTRTREDARRLRGGWLQF